MTLRLKNNKIIFEVDILYIKNPKELKHIHTILQKIHKYCLYDRRSIHKNQL